MIAEKFQIYCAKITGKHICELKILNLFILTHAPKQNSPLGFYYHYSKQMEMTHFYRLTFFENLFYPSRKERRKEYGVEKNDPNETYEDICRKF